MLELLIIIVTLVLDQASKIIAADWLPGLPNATYPLFDGVFELSYVENRGAAFGMLQNARWLFILLTLVACGALIYLMIKKHAQMHKMLRVCLSLIIAGALGNFVDRLFLGYVRDMFYFSLIDFAVFNVADAAISVGGVLLVADLLFSKKGKAFLAELDKKKAPDTAKKGETPSEQSTADTEQGGNER